MVISCKWCVWKINLASLCLGVKLAVVLILATLIPDARVPVPVS